MAEKTIAGYEYGSSLTYRVKPLFAFGGFYQASIGRESERMTVNNPFYGILVSAPLRKCDQMNFYANTRIGLVNQNFMVIVPGIETEIQIFKTISLGIGMSMRKGFLSANTNIKMKL
jgi:hypothetical protein